MVNNWMLSEVATVGSVVGMGLAAVVRPLGHFLVFHLVASRLLSLTLTHTHIQRQTHRPAMDFREVVGSALKVKHEC